MTDTDARLVAGTLELYDAELAGDVDELARLLGVAAILEWPPRGGEHDADAVRFFRAALAADPSLGEWLAFYVCAGGELVGSAGFMGPPEDGTAEIGYSIGERYRRRGYATAAVRLLAARAAAAGATRVIAHTRPDNAASIAVLERNGFVAEPGSRREGHTLLARHLGAGTDLTR